MGNSRAAHAEGRQSMMSLRGFSSGRLRLGMSLLGGRVLYGCIDLAANQNRKSGDVKPQQQNDDSAQGAINARVGVEKVEIDAESNRCDRPQSNTDHGARRDPVPVLFLYVRGEVISGREGKDY